MPTLEESVYDRRTKTMTTYTRNVSWSHLLQMQEKCTYRPTNDHTNRTELSRRLFVMVNYGHISGLAERVLMMTFRKSVKKTLAGVNEKLEEHYGPATAKIVPEPGQTSVAGHASKIRESIKSKIELGKA
ncbi:PRELI/MSF1 protein [Aphelenchoides avenae]|nr:PRELI/MSF1 protein [Aphelenchus avenae]